MVISEKRLNKISHWRTKSKTWNHSETSHPITLQQLDDLFSQSTAKKIQEKQQKKRKTNNNDTNNRKQGKNMKKKAKVKKSNKKQINLKKNHMNSTNDYNLNILFSHM